ncbi:hypothetical protein LJR289_003307 [Pseudoduganella sp. LjRoot289]|uniref:hypothetical protein n=1 Tax=Pseudoduganella sp. LjRoot289 TaxID=3342314 RepID=UPI003ECC7C6F
MRKMRIDFAAPGWRRSLYQLHPAALAGCVLGLALCTGAALYGYRMVALQRARAEQVSRMEREQRRLQVQQRAGAPGAPGAGGAAKTQISDALGKAVNTAVLQLNLPWADVQEAIAAATPPAIALLALEPDPNKQLLKISAEAKNADEMIAYIEQLKEQEFFTGAALVRHEVSDLDPNRPIRFQVEAQWGTR